jgi:vancomycin resistance protein VanW
MLKKLFPHEAKLAFRLLKRHLVDSKNGHKRLFAHAIEYNFSLPFSIEQKQEIKQTAFFENKISNISLGANFIEQVVVLPNQILSFYQIIGNPTAKNGFKTGRNIINGLLSEDIGGGLCQLSSIIYHTSLIAGLDILERYNHTVDIYEEKDRFCPLGADATVVFGYKDLRIKNPYAFPIAFEFEIKGNNLICRLKSQDRIEAKSVEFERIYQKKGILVETKAKNKLICTSFYLK